MYIQVPDLQYFASDFRKIDLKTLLLCEKMSKNYLAIINRKTIRYGNSNEAGWIIFADRQSMGRLYV